MVWTRNQRRFLFGLSANLFWIGTTVVLLLFVSQDKNLISRSLLFSNKETEECEKEETINKESFDVTYVSQSSLDRFLLYADEIVHRWNGNGIGVRIMI